MANLPFEHWGVDDYTQGFLILLCIVIAVVGALRKVKQNNCRHDHAHGIKDGYHCPQCGKIWRDINSR